LRQTLPKLNLGRSITKTGPLDGMIRLTILTFDREPSTIRCRAMAIAGLHGIGHGPFVVTFFAAAMHLTSSPEELSPLKFSPAGDGLYYLAVSVRFGANIEATPHRGERFRD
jgi:hypothetical protein